jgi:hypothetical protein
MNKKIATHSTHVSFMRSFFSDKTLLPSKRTLGFWGLEGHGESHTMPSKASKKRSMRRPQRTAVTRAKSRD